MTPLTLHPGESSAHLSMDSKIVVSDPDPKGAVSIVANTTNHTSVSPAEEHDQQERRGPLNRERMMKELLNTIHSNVALPRKENEQLMRPDYTAASTAHAVYGLCDVGDAHGSHPFHGTKTCLAAKYHLVKAKTYFKRAREAELERTKMQDNVQALKDHPEPNETLIREAKTNLADFEAKQRAESDVHYKVTECN